MNVFMLGYHVGYMMGWLPHLHEGLQCAVVFMLDCNLFMVGCMYM